jgi:hypothetical protein
VVFAAGFLLAGVITTQVVAGIGSVYAMPYADRFYADRAADESAGRLAVAGLVGLTVLSALAVVVYAVLTPLTAGGWGPGRVLTWIAVGVTVPVCLLALPLSPYSELGWYRTLNITTAMATLCFALGAAVLLALPSARPYFRHERPPAPPFPPAPPMYAPRPSAYPPPPNPQYPPRPPGWPPDRKAP